MDIKAHWETAGRKWRRSLGPRRVCIRWKKSLREEKVYLSVSEEEELSKSKADSWQEVTTLNHFISSSHYTPNLPPAPLPLSLLPLNVPLSPFPAAFSSSPLPSLSSRPHLLHCVSGSTAPSKWKVQVASYFAFQRKNVGFRAWHSKKIISLLPLIILWPFVSYDTLLSDKLTFYII